jgi:hypothetical protein
MLTYKGNLGYLDLSVDKMLDLNELITLNAEQINELIKLNAKQIIELIKLNAQQINEEDILLI